MSDSRNHSKRPRNFKRPSREGSTRSSFRSTVANGQWDDLPTTMPTRAIRRDRITVS